MDEVADRRSKTNETVLHKAGKISQKPSSRDRAQAICNFQGHLSSKGDKQGGALWRVEERSSCKDAWAEYCKTLNVSVPFISRISRAKQNRESKRHKYQLQAEIWQNYYSISNCMVLIRQNKGAKIILHAKSPTFRAAKLKGFTVVVNVL